MYRSSYLKPSAECLAHSKSCFWDCEFYHYYRWLEWKGNTQTNFLPLPMVRPRVRGHLAGRGWEDDRPGFKSLLWPYWVFLGNYLTSLSPRFSTFQLVIMRTELNVKHEVPGIQ